MQRLQLLPAARGGSGLPTIGDATGRQVILRGVNVNQLIDYYLRDPARPATEPLTDTDFAQLAALGFNVVRLGMSWSRLEPQRGVYDQAYLRQIAAAVASAKAHGIYTVLDMHQDAWGNALARPAQRCGGGTTPTTGWDGAPAWATITDATLHCQFLARDLAPAVASAFTNFYVDRDGARHRRCVLGVEAGVWFAGDRARRHDVGQPRPDRLCHRRRDAPASWLRPTAEPGLSTGVPRPVGHAGIRRGRTRPDLRRHSGQRGCQLPDRSVGTGETPPSIATEAVRDLASVRVPGGWRVTGCGAGTYKVTVSA